MKTLKMGLLSLGLLLCVCIPFFSSCSDSDDEETVDVPVVSVTLSSSSLTLNVGETSTLTVTLLPDNATYQSVTWSSSDEAIVTVADGLVTAIAAGSATVTAVAGEKSASCEIVVNEVADESIVIEGETATMNLDAFTSVQDVTNAINEADQAGVTEYVLSGDFSKLGIGTDTNPFKGLKVEVIDMSNVTGWPEVSVEEVSSRATTVVGVPANAFGRSEIDPESFLKKIVLPQSVKAIGHNAFCNCTYLVEVVMPGVLIVCEESFSGCFDLATVEAPSLQTIGAKAFTDCDDWEVIYLPSVQVVGEDAFYACDKKTREIDLPEAITLGEDAFQDCAYLEKVNLPKVKTLGDGCFSYDFCEGAVADIELPSVETVSDNAFYDCEKLARISLPKATVIGNWVFHNCHMLTTLELTASDAINTSEDTFEDFVTLSCDLLLNSNKMDEVNENVWRGRTWKSISYVN